MKNLGNNVNKWTLSAATDFIFQYILGLLRYDYFLINISIKIKGT